MTKWFESLNMSPAERRGVLIALVVVALLLNYWLVIPYFGEWGKISRESEELNRQKSRYVTEIGRKATYDRRLQELQQQGAQVPGAEAANSLQQTVYREASSAGVSIGRLTPQVMPSRVGGQTNQFFEEHIVKVDISAGEDQLVNFLYRLGTGDSMIRVRDVANLRLDPTQTKLMASLDLVASFPRRSTPAPADAAGGRTAPTPSTARATPASRP